MTGYPEHERYIRLLLKSFLAGILFFVLFYGIVFILRKESFSIHGFFRLHDNSAVFYLVDLIPFVLPVVIHFSVYRFLQFTEVLRKKLNEKDERFEQYRSAIEHLIDGQNLPADLFISNNSL
nr:hypothetical protein [Bacteroidales bacterium]